MQGEGIIGKSKHPAFCFVKEKCAYGRTWKDFSLTSQLLEHINTSAIPIFEY